MARILITEAMFFDCSAIKTGEDLGPIIKLLTRDGSRFRISDIYSEGVADSYQDAFDVMIKRGKRHPLGEKDVDGSVFGHDTFNVIYGSPVYYQREGLGRNTNGISASIWEPLDYTRMDGLGKVFDRSYDENTFKDDRINVHSRDLLEITKELFPLAKPALGFVGHMLFPDNTPKVFKAERRIPRIWWANFYGPPYVDKYGKDFLLGAPGHVTEELDDGSVFYQVTEELYLWEDSNQGPPVEEIEGYFLNHPLIKRIRYRPVLARSYLPKRDSAMRP